MLRRPGGAQQKVAWPEGRAAEVFDLSEQGLEVGLAVDVGRGAGQSSFQQLHVIVRSPEPGLPQATFPAGPADQAGAGGLHWVSLKAADVHRRMGSAYGRMALLVAVGDEALEKGVLWELGAVEMPRKMGKVHPLAAPQSFMNHVGPQEEITHVMSPPVSRPPVLISLIFTGAACAPLAFLILGFRVIGARLSRFPSSGVAFLDAAFFHGGIGAVLVLYALYWLRLTLLQTLPSLGALLLFSAVFGFRNLSNLANSK